MATCAKELKVGVTVNTAGSTSTITAVELVDIVELDTAIRAAFTQGDTKVIRTEEVIWISRT